MRKLIKRTLGLIVASMLLVTPTMASFANTEVTAVESTEELVDEVIITTDRTQTNGISPRALLTLTETQYNTSTTVGMKITYVVSDGSARLVEIKSATVAYTGDYIKVISISKFVNSSGSYGTVTVKWTQGKNKKVYTSIFTIYP